MSAPTKLTKKQKKGLAFRERKGKAKAKDFDDTNAVPVMEDEDSMGDQADSSAVAPQAQVAEDEDGSKSVAPKKRKRTDEDGNKDKDKPEPKKKRKKVEKATDKEPAAEKNMEAVKKSASKQRYILFVGNLKYTTTQEAIQKHFAACDPPPDVRLITPKASSGRAVTKSKGCAFLEFSHRNALQQALKLHQSELEGRNINVELTAGGGGKSESRLEKLKKRNRELHEQRKKQIQKTRPSKDTGAGGEVQVERPQRYSATSGFEQTPLKKRTWTIGDDTEPNNKKAKKKRSVPRALGTGVNAIPVG